VTLLPTANLIQNPGFENGLSPWNFVPGSSNPLATLENSQVHTGAWALDVQDSDEGLLEFTLSQTVTVLPGIPYIFSFWALNLDPESECILGILLGGVLSYNVRANVGTGWTQLTASPNYPGTTGGNTTIELSIFGNGCIGPILLDDFSFVLA